MPDNTFDLTAARSLARAALVEITPEATIGEPFGHVVEEEGVVSFLFESRLAGYPGWRWTVTVGRAAEDAEPTVLEAELMPGDGALLAPDWVPWSERLADYQAAQEALAAEAEGDEADDEDADDDLDGDILDLHGDDDVDGVDIDSVDVAYDEKADDEQIDDEQIDDGAEQDLAVDGSAALSPAGSAPSFDAEVGQPEAAQGNADDDGLEPPTADVGEPSEDQRHDEGEKPES